MRTLKKHKEQKNSIRTILNSKYFGIFLAMILVLITSVIWISAKADNLAKLTLNMESVSEIYSSKIKKRIDNIEFSLAELAGYGPPNTLEEEEGWDMRTDFYIENLNGIANIVWLDRNLIIRRVNPTENNEYIVNTEFNNDQNKSDYTNLILPIYNEEVIAGFILCDIDVSVLILSVIDEYEENYMIQVFDGNQLLASSDNWEQLKSDVSVEKDISFKSRIYSFILTPTKEILSASTRNSIWIIIFGISISALVAGIWYSKSVSGLRLEGLVAKKTKELTFEIEEKEKRTNELVIAQKLLEEANINLEDRVVERTAQLEAANKELESFSYSVSHDLKAPARHITGFAALLENKYANLLPEEGKKYLENITFSAAHMGELVDGLLQFSRAGRVKIKKVCLNMNEIIETLIKPIVESDIDHKIEFDIASLPSSYGDLEMLKSVWSNLIENAVKFSKNKPISKIQIGFQETKSEITYFIKDNGAGFDMAYSTKLFNVFQRLHSLSEFEGTGIGLATIKRIITKHNGNTWGEGLVDSGATFYFTLLKRKEDI